MMRSKGWRKILLGFWSLLLLWGEALYADNKDRHPPVLLKADRLRHEDDLGIVVAEGHVVASDGQKIVQADRLIYNKLLNNITAIGNVRLFMEDGNVVSCGYLELSDNFKEVFSQAVYVVTPEDEKVAAALIQKDGPLTTYQQAAYTPCLVCQTKSPLWQIKAEKVTYDQETENVYYQHAFLEMKNVPVAYMPYFSHAGPRVKRRSGFLAPILGSQTKLGAIIGIPYYFNVAPHKDLTVTPVETMRAGPALGAEYRHRFGDANLLLRGSITYTDQLDTHIGAQKKRAQGHFFGATQGDLTDQWRLSGQIFKSSSPGYLRRYSMWEGGQYWRQNYLETNLNTEGFYDRNYVGIQGYNFQNLRSDVDSKTVPNVIPFTTFSYISPESGLGSHFHLTGETLSLQRKTGPQMNRLSSTVTWVLPYAANHGSIYELHTFLRGDAYDIRRYSYTHNAFQTNSKEAVGRGRGIPGASLCWRFPFASRISSTRWVIEPMIKGVAKPNGLNSAKFPNEDSQDFEFDTRNLFLDNRFIGKDVVDDGQHISYGVNMSAYNIQEINMRGFLGQSYDFSKVNRFPTTAGVRKGASDYLGRFKIIPNEWGSLEWRFMADNRSHRIKKNVVTVIAGPDKLRLQVDYLYNDSIFFDKVLKKREQIAWRVSSKFIKDWSLFIGGRRELKNIPGPLEASIGAMYEDECFRFLAEGLKTYYRDYHMIPATTILFTLSFKNLGEVSTNRLTMRDWN